MSKALSLLIEELLSFEEIKQFQKLEKIILNNEEISTLLEHLQNVEKQAVNAKELGLENTYYAYKKEYDQIIASFEDNVLISSYIDAKEETLKIINLVTSIIESEINKAINA